MHNTVNVYQKKVIYVTPIKRALSARKIVVRRKNTIAVSYFVSVVNGASRQLTDSLNQFYENLTFFFSSYVMYNTGIRGRLLTHSRPVAVRIQYEGEYYLKVNLFEEIWY